jgi:hypothetical protein
MQLGVRLGIQDLPDLAQWKSLRLQNPDRRQLKKMAPPLLSPRQWTIQ